MRILLTGITGAIGGRLAPPLLDAGHEVVALTRRHDLARLRQHARGVRLLTGNAASGVGLDRAMDGVEVAYYLIHSMESGADGALLARERQAASNFAQAARAAGVRRVVYLGGMIGEGARSEHLESRLEVERVLLEAIPDSVALRASIVIGARSRSFRLLVRLIERLPVLVIPAWGSHRTTPVDERDVVACLLACATARKLPARTLDLAGPEVVTYRALIERIRELMILDRPTLALARVTLTPLASRLAALVAAEDHGLIRPLMESLYSDLLPREPSATEALGVRPHRLDAAIERALRDWESSEPLRGR